MLVKCQYLSLTEVGAGAEAGVGGLEVDPHQGLIGHSPQVPKIVVGVVKDTHLRSAQPIIKFAKGAKLRATSNNIAKQRTQVVPTNLGGLEGNNLRYQGGLSNHLVTTQGLIMSSVKTQYTLYSTKDPKLPIQATFYLFEISNTQVLGDVKLANRAGRQLTQRFKLDSGACANLLPIGIYNKLFSKQDRDLKGSIDPRVSLIAANNNTIKQLGTVRLRVKAGGLEKVCRFFVVPNHCRPILGLPDLLRMDMVQFKVPTTNQWSNYVGEIDSKVPGLTKEQILSEYKDVFTGLGRLKVEHIKIHLKEGARPCSRPCRRVPIAMRQKFKEELDSLEHKLVLRKLKPNEVPEWLNSFVCPVKDDGGLRVCLDPTGLNPYIVRPVFNSHISLMK